MGTGPAPINHTAIDDDILCVNTEPRNSDAYAIYLSAINDNHYVDLTNSGTLTVIAPAGQAFGIIAQTVLANNSPVSVVNSGEITATALDQAIGIVTSTIGVDSPTGIVNSGDITVTSAMYEAYGIRAQTQLAGSPIGILNSGAITATSSGVATEISGIKAETDDANSPIGIVNSGDITATGTGAYSDAYGIQARSGGTGSSIFVENSGDMTIMAPSDAVGIFALAQDTADLPVTVMNSGNLTVTSGSYLARGINATSVGENSPTSVWNSGDLTVTVGNFPYALAIGIDAGAGGGYSPLAIENHGAITATGYDALAILAQTGGAGNPIAILNSGELAATALNNAYGIVAETADVDSPIAIQNSGGIALDAGDSGLGIFAITLGVGAGFSSPIAIQNDGDITINAVRDALGILAGTIGSDSPIAIVNNGDINTTAATEDSIGITAATGNVNSSIAIQNSGDIAAAAGNGPLSEAIGILAETFGPDSPIVIGNSGSIFADGLNSTGIFAFSGANDIVIVNTGSISASSLIAINTEGTGRTTIYNYDGGVITGAVDLAGGGDRFFNQAGGTFEARRNSYFGGSPDLFRNEKGGIVHTADNPLVSEYTAFFELERFQNRGLISLVDGRAGDIFRISDTLPLEPTNYFFDGGIVFNASGDSTLAVDTFLGGPGSASDIFIISGDVTGKTALQVNNTNAGAGVFNPEGIPVVFVGGNVKSDAFFLPQPIDTGFFDYDLFFVPENSGFFELRSFVGGGALLLPQLVTATQDIWHQGSSTWFDRTADLRVLLAGGATPIAYDPNGGYANGAAAGPTAFTPAVWARGSGAWLDRDGRESVGAYGRTYTYDLSRDLDVIDWQMGLDLGKRDLFSQGDILVFGVLGGFVGADLDYNQLARGFDFEGGQVGGYATYLNGGLFVDTLLNAHLLELETATLGFPSSLDATTVGLRTDAGYRFGSFSGGAFIEPLATIAVLWSDIDGFTNGGNRVSFDDEANVRGRLGMRVGTSYPVWTGTTMEPFVIGSLWGNLSGDNQATLTSSGTTFRFEDDLDDVWGEVSAGVNFFNPSASTAVFAKVDVTFGDDVEGIGGKAGMRVSW